MSIFTRSAALACLVIVCTVAAPSGARSASKVSVTPVAKNLTAPLLLVSPPDGTGRRFIVEQTGQIWILNSMGEVLSEPFFDISDQLVPLQPEYDERGLLGLAFHPDFAENHRFFVFYSVPLRDSAPDDWDHTNRVSEYVAQEANPDLADMASEQVILEEDWPYLNHNGGALAFGPDNYLYISFGDGGNANDVGRGHSDIGNAQDITNLWGDILRLDVDTASPYMAPPDNPFMGREGRDEIFAYGFRNPHRLSFDMAGDHWLYASDAGQNRWEEIDHVELGKNYGWNIREGSHCFDPKDPDNPPSVCPTMGYRNDPLIKPLGEYLNVDAEGGWGAAVVGGYVYRGSRLPELYGHYIFGDFSHDEEAPDGLLLTLEGTQSPIGSTWHVEELKVDTKSGRLGHYVKGFGQDADGEMYVMVSDNAGPSGSSGQVLMLGEQENSRGTASTPSAEVPRLMLGANEPNPFSSSTRIRFALTNAADLSVQIFDASGRNVRRLFDGHLPAGAQEVAWNGELEDGRAATAGVYFCRIVLPGEGSQTQRLFLVR